MQRAKISTVSLYQSENTKHASRNTCNSKKRETSHKARGLLNIRLSVEIEFNGLLDFVRKLRDRKEFFMKQIIIALLLLLFTAQFAAAELTKEDLKEIGKLLDKQKKEIKSYIDIKIAGVEKAIEILQWVIGMLALFLAAGIILPLVLQVLRERKRILLTNRVEKLEQQLTYLTEQKTK